MEILLFKVPVVIFGRCSQALAISPSLHIGLLHKEFVPTSTQASFHTVWGQAILLVLTEHLTLLEG